MFYILGKLNCKIHSHLLISSLLLKELTFNFYLKHIHHVFFVIARKMFSHNIAKLNKIVIINVD